MILDKVTKGVGDAIEKVPEVYDDGLKDTVQESGKLVSLIPKTINAVLSPLRQWIAQKEYNVAETEKLLAKKLENIDQDKIVSPESYVAVPAIQAISYSMNSEELREMYTNLLAKAMYKDTKNEVHPSFVEIIKQMSPLDSLVFKYIMERDVNPMIHLNMKNSERSFHILMKNVTDINIASQKLISVSIDNLTRMNLIQIPDDRHYKDERIYDGIFQSEFYQEQCRLYPKTEDGYELNYIKKAIDKTNLGILFYEICIKEI